MACTSEVKYVDLGFAEEQESWLLTNRYFPSKIGGKIALLDLLCEYCNEPCIFLCQVYAGSEKVSHAFHRSIFVFICKNGKCCSLNQSGNIKVLRSQLPLKNQFYPDTPPDETIESEPIKPSVNLCNVCGCKGPMVCGKCRKIHYCGQVHQKLDWKTHKKLCGKEDTQQQQNSEVLFPEYEIVIEREESSNIKGPESEKEAEKRRLREYDEMVKNGKTGGMSDISEKDLQEFAESKEDKTFGKFKKAIEENPTQVLRYSRHGKPLWISDNGILNSSQIPKCNNCGSRRTFEFQIMPQMLNELKNYEIDWGIIAIYTCEKDCDITGKYVEEFCYKQDIIKGNDDIDTDMKMTQMNVNDESDDEELKEEEKPKEKMPKTQLKTKKPQSNGNQTKKSFQESDDW
ncbi:hypothetical protein PVAND_000452 [Polypedilum vanderplanki]|uniref:MYND-type domain-containing protein n=1 Tax=Polypedilum vanderplanki TaxID=319348 RepID=A0A9J6BL00_POLVA|nr:hypothetical protein PVAND_000452 [Polypedilum vanderplanki]